MTTNPTLIYDNSSSPTHTSLSGYAERHKVTDRTVKRWLSGGLIPGATKNLDGHWLIPIDAPRPQAPDPSSGSLVQVYKPAEVAIPDPVPSPIAQLTPGRTFYSAREAAEIMSCEEVPVSEYIVKKNREYFHATLKGRDGMVMVPAYRLMQLKGMIPA